MKKLDPIPNDPNWKGIGRQCAARSKRSGARCTHAATNGSHVCNMHGAKGGRKKADGSEPEPRLVKMEREQFIKALKGEQGERAQEIIEKLREMGLSGNLQALTYMLDQAFGKATQTVNMDVQGDVKLYDLTADEFGQV